MMKSNITAYKNEITALQKKSDKYIEISGKLESKMQILTEVFISYYSNV